MSIDKNLWEWWKKNFRMANYQKENKKPPFTLMCKYRMAATSSSI